MAEASKNCDIQKNIDGNWSSFQLAKIASPSDVIDSDPAPPARMDWAGPDPGIFKHEDFPKRFVRELTSRTLGVCLDTRLDQVIFPTIVKIGGSEKSLRLR